MQTVRHGVRTQTGGNEMTKWERFERVLFLIGLIVVALDLYYWRP